MSKHHSPSCRLFLLHDKLDDLMEVLVGASRTAAEEVRFRNVERRYWPVKHELMRRLKERDALIAKIAALRPLADAYRARIRWDNASSYDTAEECASAWTEYLAATRRAIAFVAGATP